MRVSSKMPPARNTPNRLDVASDVVASLLSLAKDTTDGVPFASGVFGGLSWIVETAQV
jgi:hypothetical protein